jgi:hypothetical protein
LRNMSGLQQTRASFIMYIYPSLVLKYFSDA